MFTFLTPLFLIGTLAAAIPLVVHLSRSRRQKKMVFSTTRFFTDQFLRSYRMSRVKELLLLLARMTLFAFFAMALAQPVFLPRGRSFLTGQRTVVLVLDNSASMGYVEDGLSLFDRARAAAREVIDGLKPGDSASVVLAARRSAGPEALFPEPTTALGDVRRAVDGLRVSALGTDLAGALARAGSIASSGSANSREVYLLSDLQDSGWEIGRDTASVQGQSEVLFFLVGIRPKKPQNLSVTALQFAAARPMAGIPFLIRPHVLNQGSTARAAEVSLVVDGQKLSQQRLEHLQPGHWAVPLLHVTFARGGWHSGYVEVEDPYLVADNRRYFALEVVDSVRLLAVNGAPSQVARLDELHYLKTALAAAPGGKSSIVLDETTPAEFGRKDLAPYQAVVLANVESLAPAAVERLEEYVDRGGSLFVFLGDKTRPEFYNQVLSGNARLHGGLLPARLRKIEGDPAAARDVASVGEVDPENAALGAFADPRFASLDSVTFQAFWVLEPRDAVVLMRANTGAPLLCEKSFGKGRVLLFASSCDRDWTNFPVKPAYLPWVHRLVAYLAQRSPGRKTFFHTGERVPLSVSATAGAKLVQVKRPDGAVVPATTGDDPRMPLQFDDTAQPGVYEIVSAGGAGELSPLFVANVESYESDLTYLDDVLADRAGPGKPATRRGRIEAGFRELLPGRPLIAYVDNPSQIAVASMNARRGVKLWDIVLGIVLALALVEPWLANRISLRHYVGSAASVNSKKEPGRSPSHPGGRRSVVAFFEKGADEAAPSGTLSQPAPGPNQPPMTEWAGRHPTAAIGREHRP